MSGTVNSITQAESILAASTLDGNAIVSDVFQRPDGTEIDPPSSDTMLMTNPTYPTYETGDYLDLSAPTFSGTEGESGDINTVTFYLPGSSNDPNAAADIKAGISDPNAGFFFAQFSGGNFTGQTSLYKLAAVNNASPTGEPSIGPNTVVVAELVNHGYRGSDGALLLQPTSGNFYIDLASGGSLLPLDNQAGVPGAKLTFTPFSSAPCYTRGTRLATPSGEIAVEALQPGDVVSVIDNGERSSRPVTWVGHRFVDIATHPDPITVRPVRIQRDAFGVGMPARDLSVSPDHAIAVDGVLIPARLLVNGVSIIVDDAAISVTYYHVELDRHAVVLAEGLMAESYLDTGNRSMFENGGSAIALRADFSVETRRANSGETCLPLRVDAETVRPVWMKLAERAAAREATESSIGLAWAA